MLGRAPPAAGYFNLVRSGVALSKHAVRKAALPIKCATWRDEAAERGRRVLRAFRLRLGPVETAEWRERSGGVRSALKARSVAGTPVGDSISTLAWAERTGS